MQRLTNKYHQDHQNEGNFIYSSSGSRGGLSSMEAGIYQVGFISRNIDATLAKQVVTSDGGFKIDQNKSQQENQTALFAYLEKHQSDGEKLNYFQMGTDAVVLTYYPTNDFAKYYADQFVINPQADKDQQLIYDLYQGNLTFVDLAMRLSGETRTQVLQKLTNVRNLTPIVPYARETGSGTRNSFELLFNFQKFETGKPSKALEFNSNGIMFTGIQSAVNTFGYLSLNYLLAIRNDPHLKTVLISDGNGHNFDPLAAENFHENEILLENFQNYTLTRPYIGLFKANTETKILERIAEFLAWIGEALKTDQQTEARIIYQIEGLIPEMNFNFALTT
jgi:phosphate transport system substrate-binding protein